ncbi:MULTISPECIES: serine hydrolase domain-containing protein [Metabacillus]|uniref:Penicillin-binding protein n=2 Tax=Metabacillus TaxID=2675233 RepID=A0A179SV94_9BACI|nr:MULTISPECIES: serine hydrolase [Metabacillus]OAS84223.1 penicillin-binding protein [Metabacillus litoralis]QNF29904.1 serine hydrolase [Metabacillus sp. KUDC1714]
MKTNILNRIAEIQDQNKFSGSVLVKEDNEVLAEVSYGYANRSEQIENSTFTRYGIASGCKLFTSIAICQLVEDEKLSFETKLEDCLNVSFPNFDKDITIHHLLTHTSGIPDYFDEEVMDDFEELWIKNPMYHIRTLEDFLPLFQNQPMKLKVGERFHYNNAGYILLGLIVEQASQLQFTDYIEGNIFKKAGMVNSGYFEFDSLPKSTALGYIDLPNGTWKTNIYSLPVKGGSDGGAFVTVNDMANLWDSLVNNQLLSEEYTHMLLTPYIRTNDKNSFYGYGVWIEKNDDEIIKYHIMGYDPGVSFHSAFYPKTSIKTVICSNKSKGAYGIMKEIEEEI